MVLEISLLKTSQGVILLSILHHYIHAIEVRLFLLLELHRIKNRFKRSIPPFLWKRIIKHPSHAEDWVNFLCFLRPDENILLIDAGANNGSWAAEFMTIFPVTELAAFEPCPSMYRELRLKTRRMANARVYPFALSNREEQRPFYIGEDKTLSSFQLYNETVNAYRKHRPDEKHIVQCKRLDSFDFNTANKKVVLKIDVQGHEVFLIEGAEKLLGKLDLCLCEVSFASQYIGHEPSFARVSELLQKYGLYPIVFQDYGRMLSNYASERDVLFAKKTLLDNIWLMNPILSRDY